MNDKETWYFLHSGSRGSSPISICRRHNEDILRRSASSVFKGCGASSYVSIRALLYAVLIINSVRFMLAPTEHHLKEISACPQTKSIVDGSTGQLLSFVVSWKHANPIRQHMALTQTRQSRLQCVHTVYTHCLHPCFLCHGNTFVILNKHTHTPFAHLA